MNSEDIIHHDFCFTFNKTEVVKVSRDEQLARSQELFATLRDANLLYKNWYLCPDPGEGGLEHNIFQEKDALLRKAKQLYEEEYGNENKSGHVAYVIWNGIESPIQGGTSLVYDAHHRPHLSRIELESAWMYFVNDPSFSGMIIDTMQNVVALIPEISWAWFSPDEWSENSE